MSQTSTKLLLKIIKLTTKPSIGVDVTFVAQRTR